MNRDDVAVAFRITTGLPGESRTRQALADLLAYAEAQICPHEDTYRGGAIWEICHQCGAKWADDQGGRPPDVTPEPIARAAAILAEGRL